LDTPTRFAERFNKDMGMVSFTSSINETIAPLCSVCIANYNGERFIEKCIESILKQENVTGAVEIIVHDDASKDDSVALIRSRYPEILLLESKENLGFCISNNRMVAMAKGKFILLLNNDATLHADALRTLYEASVAHGDGIYGLPQYDASTGELIDIGSVFDPFLNPIPNKNLDRTDVGMIIGACLFLPKHLWETLGGFPEWFGSLSEDLYLCSYARLRGFPVKAIATSGFYHWVGQSFGGGRILSNKKLSTKLSRRSLSERNKTFVMLICYPSLLVYLLIPLHLVLLIFEGLLLTVIKQDKRVWLQIYWFCLREVWKKRMLWVEQRRVVQHDRRCSTSLFLSTFTFFPHKMRMLFIYGMPNLR